MKKQHMKNLSRSLVIMEMQFKTTVRYHYVPSKISLKKQNPKNSIKSKCWKMYQPDISYIADVNRKQL